MARAGFVIASAALVACSTLLGFETLREDAGVGSDASPDDSAVTPLPDVALPPPPTTCKKTGLACVPAAPSGWAGPFALYAGASSDVPGCVASTPVLTAYTDLVPPPPASCGTCTCSVATGFTCGPVPVTGGCSCPAPTRTAIPANGCTERAAGFIQCSGAAAVQVTVSAGPADAGHCDPLSAKPTVSTSELVWNQTALGCQLSIPSQVDCPQGNVCAAVADPPFNPHHCVMKAGNVKACPGFPYSKPSLFYRRANDTRDCTACACGAPAAATCVASVNSVIDAGCDAGALIGTPACLPVSTTGSTSIYVRSTPPVNVQCAPSGGESAGGVNPTDEVTVCCME